MNQNSRAQFAARLLITHIIYSGENYAAKRPLLFDEFADNQLAVLRQRFLNHESEWFINPTLWCDLSDQIDQTTLDLLRIHLPSILMMDHVSPLHRNPNYHQFADAIKTYLAELGMRPEMTLVKESTTRINPQHFEFDYQFKTDRFHGKGYRATPAIRLDLLFDPKTSKFLTNVKFDMVVDFDIDALMAYLKERNFECQLQTLDHDDQIIKVKFNQKGKSAL